MQRIAVGSGVRMITEIRREAPVFPTMPSGKRLVLVLALLAAAALANVWLTGEYYRAGYAVSAVLEERMTLQKEREQLRTEILTLRSPARIEAIARNELGMVDPKTDRIILAK